MKCFFFSSSRVSASECLTCREIFLAETLKQHLLSQFSCHLKEPDQNRRAGLSTRYIRTDDGEMCVWALLPWQRASAGCTHTATEMLKRSDSRGVSGADSRFLKLMDQFRRQDGRRQGNGSRRESKCSGWTIFSYKQAELGQKTQNISFTKSEMIQQECIITEKYQNTN